MHNSCQSTDHYPTPQVPDVKWDDVGGLEDVKAAILDTVELPLRHRCGGACE